jgi:hypothetical protein
MDKRLVKYVWVDEDGEAVSPQHTTFRSAVSFINSYAMRKQRIETGLKRARQRDDRWELERRETEEANLTKTGKDPVKLRRLVIAQTFEDPSADEQRVADLFLPVR